MSDYYCTLIKDIIENNDKEKAIEIIANKLNEKQLSNEKEILTQRIIMKQEEEIERLHSIIKEAIELLESKKHCEKLFGGVEEKTFTEQAIKILKGE